MKRSIAVWAAALALYGCKDKSEPETVPQVPAETAAQTGTPAEAAAEAAPEPADDGPFKDFNWTAVSADSTATVTHSHVGGGKCRRTCNDAPGGAEVWAADGCIGKRIDLRFVGNDCQRVVVLHQLPTVKPGSRWEQVEVGHVYDKAKLAYPIAAAGAVRDFKKIRSAGSTFYWLQGALSVPGSPPRYSADGTQVEFTTVDGKQQQISLVADK